jgi:N-acetylmuramoyl-L-alanine amidase
MRKSVLASLVAANFAIGCTMPTFAPDSSLVTRVVVSPNHDERTLGGPDILLLHYTGMASTEAAVQRLCDPLAKVSAHYVVDEDGRISQLVPERRRAYHAGASSWEGESDINSRSIGIEIGNPGRAFGYPDFPARQIEAVIALARDIVARRAIRADRVLAHSDVSPGRKNDPGEKFPWDKLAAAGVGLWVAPRPLAAGAELNLGDSGKAVGALQRDLAHYGYGIEATGRFDERTRDVVIAFQRHFRPARVDGIADRSTRETLAALLAKRDQRDR